MNMILYTPGDSSILDSLNYMSYNYIRSHHYYLFHLARYLGCHQILDAKPSRTKLVPLGTDLYYTLNEFKEYNLKSACLSDWSDSVGVVFHQSIETEVDYVNLLEFMNKCKKIIYYVSDPEFDSSYLGGKMVLNLIKENEYPDLTKIFINKGLILSGFKSVQEECVRYFSVPCIYVPQLINPNIPIFSGDKMYDAFMINTNSCNKKIADYLSSRGAKLLVLTSNRDYCENQDFIECKGSGLNLDLLLSAMSLCRYHATTYRFLTNPDPEMIDKYTIHNHTFKYFECYYANSLPMTANKSLSMIGDIVTSKELYNQSLSGFRRYMEDNFKLSNFTDTLYEIKEYLRK